MSRRVLLVDDEQSVCWALEQVLEGEGHICRSAPTAERGIEMALEWAPELIFLDVRLPGRSGLDALAELRAAAGESPVVVMTAHATMETAVEAIRRGAFDYLTKPLDVGAVRDVARRALSSADEAAELPDAGSGSMMVGKSPVMQEVFKQIGVVAGGESTVLLLGESGTGKDIVARAIHQASPRAEGPFEPINCASLPDGLLESELFGHERGAFTGAVREKRGKFEVADGGTLFLDEVAELPLVVQSKLLRVIEERSFTRVGGLEHRRVDVRILAATNRDLERRVADGLFREDLYFRLNVVTIRTPPLREWIADLPVLVAHLLDRFGGARISREALKALARHPWPGNVRELSNALEHARLMARGDLIRSEHLPEHVTRLSVGLATDDIEGLIESFLDRHVEEGAPLHESLMALWEAPLIRLVLRRTEGNQVQAARLLGIHRTTLRQRIERYEIEL